MDHAFSSLSLAPLDEREVRRHLWLFHQVSKELGGPVPTEMLELTSARTVLDVACGPGGWAFDLACTYPHLQVTGIDTDARCIAAARRLAHADGFGNVCFLVHDLCGAQGGADLLPGAPFDLLHLAFLAPALLTTDYPALLRVLFRLCRPGGMLLWTEMEFPITNSPAVERLTTLTCHALQAAGHSFTPPSLQEIAAIFEHWQREAGHSVRPYERHLLGITPMMERWVRQSGYRQVRQIAAAIDISAGAEAHACFVQQAEAFGRQIRPFLLKQQVITGDAYEVLRSQLQGEVQQETFCGLCFLLSVLGHKLPPGNTPSRLAEHSAAESRGAETTV